MVGFFTLILILACFKRFLIRSKSFFIIRLRLRIELDLFIDFVIVLLFRLVLVNCIIFLGKDFFCIIFRIFCSEILILLTVIFFFNGGGGSLVWFNLKCILFIKI